MHELSLMAAVRDLALEQAALRGGGTIRVIRLRIGNLAGVDPDCLRLAAEVVLEESAAAGAQLELIAVPALCRCSGCGTTYEAIDGLCVCPRCAALGGELLQGRELELQSLVLDQDARAG
jgi:hydrogenase nickel incorporation protein HypA/HybF